MCYMAFTYKENTHNKDLVCYGFNKAVATDMFAERTKGLDVTGFGFYVGTNFQPVSGLEILPRAVA